MRQVILQKPRKIITQEVVRPSVIPGWVLIKTECCGICGSDVHAYLGETIFGNVYPFNIGHEVCGHVEESMTSSPFKEGDMVVINPFFSCGSCSECYNDQPNHCHNGTTIGLKGPGGFSEFILVPESSVYKPSNEISPERLCFAEPIANVIYAIKRIKFSYGMKVLINGVGPIGLIFLQLIRNRLSNCISVCDLNRQKLEKAGMLGADRLIEAQDVDDETYDLIIDCTGVAMCIESDVHKMNIGGQLISFGVCRSNENITINPFELYKRDMTITSTYALNKSSMQEAVSLLCSDRFDTECLIDSVRYVSDIEQAFKDIAGRRTSGKVLIRTQI